MSLALRSALCSVAAVLLLSSPAVAAPLGGSSATAGFRIGDDIAGAFVDFVLPVVATSKGVGFVNPRFNLEDQEQNGVNVGAGWRQLAFDDRVLFGGNVYFDSRHSAHDNRFNQLGVGLEALSRWVDLRANYYLPEHKRELITSLQTETVETSVATTVVRSEGFRDPYATENQIAQDYAVTTLATTTTTTRTTRRLFEQSESAMEGFDAEIGALLPLPATFPAVRLFGGYYSFEDAFDNRVQGPKGRVEVRIGSFLTLDGELFDDDELNGTRYYAGARLETPFDLAAFFTGKNPFAPRSVPALTAPASRMLEMVIRDPRVQTGESALAENEEARNLEVAVEENRTSTSSTRTYVLMDGVTFVDDGNTSGIEDGTAEHPYSAIQSGVDASGANTTVYVFAGDYASVTLIPGVTLWGEGTVVQGYGGRQFGGGEYPTVGGDSPAVIVASDTRVTGFHITNNDDDGIYGEIASGSVMIDNNLIDVVTSFGTVSASGIHLVSVNAGVTISGNAITLKGGSGNCIAMETSGDTAAAIADNTIVYDGSVKNWPQAVVNRGVKVVNEGGSLALEVSGNSITSSSDGLLVSSTGSGSVSANVSGNTISARSTGMNFSVGDTAIILPQPHSDATMTLVANANIVEGGTGMLLSNSGGTIKASVSDNTITVDGLDGYGLSVLGVEGSTTATFTDNTVNIGGNSISMITVIGIDATMIDAEMDLTLSGNTVNAGTGATASGYRIYGYESDVMLAASGNQLSGDMSYDMALFTTSGTFSVSAAAPGASGDLSGLNNGMGVDYNPDSTSFTFVP